MEDYRIKPGTKIKLDDWDPDETGQHGGSKAEAEEELSRLTREPGSLTGVIVRRTKT